jgi:hypothetical protein
VGVSPNPIPAPVISPAPENQSIISWGAPVPFTIEWQMRKSILGANSYFATVSVTRAGASPGPGTEVGYLVYRKDCSDCDTQLVRLDCTATPTGSTTRTLRCEGQDTAIYANVTVGTYQFLFEAIEPSKLANRDTDDVIVEIK